MIKGYACKEKSGQREPFGYNPGALDTDEVEVEVEFCGICYSDLLMIDNDWGMSSHPFTPGHEGIDKSIAVGSQVAKSRIDLHLEKSNVVEQKLIEWVQTYSLK